MPDWCKYVQDHLPALHVSPERETEIARELALQLEQAYSDALRAGLSEAEAQQRAHQQVRDWDRLASEINDAERPAPKPETFTGTLHDVRHAFRFLRRNPLLATVAIATLAFGIGANTAIFTIVDAIALRGLPYEQPGRLMAIETRRTSQPEIEPWSSALDFFDVRERTRSFAKLAGVSPIWNVVMTGRGETQRLEALYVSAEFLPMLGVRPTIGRLFVAEDDNKTHPTNVVILSHAFWQKQFGGSEGALGQSVSLDGGVYTIAGVLPPDFRYLGEPLAGTATNIDVWFPLAANQLIGTPRGLRFLKLIGRLNPGITPAQANGEIGRTGSALAKEFPASNDGFAWTVSPLNDQIAGRSRTTLFLLLGAVGFVLLMACANVAHLLLARAATRQRDLAVRVALGASKYRLLRHLLSEGAVLAFIGAGAGILLALALLKFLIAAGPAALLQTRVIKLDFRALLFTATAAILSAILSGLLPAWRVVRSEIGTALRQGGRGLTAGHHRLRAALVVAQVGLALVLLVGAGLLIHSFVRLLDVNPGFDSRHLLTFSTQVPNSAQRPEQRTSIYLSIRDELLILPGVSDVAAVSRLPLLGSNLGTWLFREGHMQDKHPPDIEYRGATPNYFSTMGIPLRKGRIFDDHDGTNPVVVIDEMAAAKYWPGQDPVGQRIKIGPNPDKQAWITITGVVGSVRHSGIAIDPQPHVYRPYAQNPFFSPILVIRTAGDPSPMTNTITSRVRSVNQQIPVYNVFTMQALVERSTAQRRFVMLLLTGFAGAALLLALVGIYGTVAQSVVQRSQEIGLRMALGATPGAALRLVLNQGFRLIGAGLVAGTLASLALTRLMQSMLFEVHPLDPLVLIGAALTLAAFALMACYWPARRATRVDPIIALRVE